MVCDSNENIKAGDLLQRGGTIFEKGGWALSVITLGPFLIHFELIIVVVSVFAGYLALNYRLRKVITNGENIGNEYATALILGFFVWKFSLLLFDPISVIQYPMSLLYFNGGDRGIGLAIIISILFLGFRTHKDGTLIGTHLDGLAAGWIAGSGIYHLMLIITDTENLIFHTLFAALQVFLALFLYSRKAVVVNPIVIIRSLIWYSLGMNAIIFTHQDRDLFIFGFSKEQIIGFAIFITAIFVDYVVHIKQKEEVH